MNDLTTILALGGAGGIVAACWGYIKSVLTRITGLLIVRVTVTYSMKEVVETLVWKEFTHWRSSFPTYGTQYWFVQPNEKYQRVGFEEVGAAPMLFWKGWRPVLVCTGKDDDNLTLTFIRGMFSPDTLMTDALARFNVEMDGDEEGRFQVVKFQGKGRGNGATSVSLGGKDGKKPKSDDDDVPSAPRGCGVNQVKANVRLLEWERNQLGAVREGRKAIDRMAIDANTQQAITEARHWAKSGNWYRERQIPWRRGWLLHGPPGTGKSSLSAAIAQDLGLPLYAFDLGSMSNKELSSFWKQAISNSPAVVLIEDIDAVFHGRENVMGENGGGLSFDALLNTISGVENADGIFLIITTNHIEHIDPALGLPVAGSDISTRPGRVDRTIKLSPPDADGRYKIATRILAEHGTAELLAQLVNAGEEDTGAQFQERCSMCALELYWRSRDLKPPEKP